MMRIEEVETFVVDAARIKSKTNKNLIATRLGIRLLHWKADL